ncbi:Uncharacterized protein TCM_031490 [Theobroma cacao]|uniref:Uncharacterized protein n=1 Tax=Theobroma cacao TaxID=3641 RepID=A0A061F8E2_THECC|nr:Uncharacterized protein TCM_031490 [Theobroma cacao]
MQQLSVTIPVLNILAKTSLTQCNVILVSQLFALMGSTSRAMTTPLAIITKTPKTI